jgi:hypothetical protein
MRVIRSIMVGAAGGKKTLEYLEVVEYGKGRMIRIPLRHGLRPDKSEHIQRRRAERYFSRHHQAVVEEACSGWGSKMLGLAKWIVGILLLLPEVVDSVPLFRKNDYCHPQDDGNTRHPSLLAILKGWMASQKGSVCIWFETRLF